MLLPLMLTLSVAEIPVYVGTYTSSGGSRGIYRVLLDRQTGELSKPMLATEATAPSFLAVHPNGQFLYAVNEASGGDVTAFAIAKDGHLQKLNTESGRGAGPCHVSVDRAGKHLLTAAYGGGSVACLPIKTDGSLGPATSVFQNTGHGPDKGRQEGPHAHAIYAGPGDRFVYACDLGTDEVLTFRFDAASGELKPANPRSVKPGPGAGPRHLAFHPSGRFAFVNNEMGNSVTSFGVDGATGKLSAIQTLSTLPSGVSHEGKTTAEIACHPAGKWLYVSNRGHDSIAVFGLSGDGKMTLLEVKPAGVRNPRGFDLDPSGRWLVVAGQNSGDLTSFEVRSDGRLRATGSRVSVDKPVCVAFGKR